MWKFFYTIRFLLACELARVQAAPSQQPGYAQGDSSSELPGQDLQELPDAVLVAVDPSIELPPALGEASAKTDAIVVDVEVPTHALQGDLDDDEALAIGVQGC